MSIKTQEPPDAIEFLRPLVLRTRPEGVSRELSEMARLSRAAALKHAAAGKPAWETLVAMARAYQRAGDQEAAQCVSEILAQRVSPSIAKRVSAWPGLTPEERTDAKQEMLLAVVRGVLNVEPGQELWECSFTHCFNRRLIDVWKAGRRRGREVSLTHESSEGEDYDGLAQIADPSNAFAAVEDEAFCKRLAGTAQALWNEDKL